MNKTTNLYAIMVIGFLSFILLTIFENNQHISQILNSFYSDSFKEALASTEEEEEKSEQDSLEQKICNKLFESETCEKVKEDKPIEKEEELTEEEIKAEALINRYLEPVEPEKQSNDNLVNGETEIGSSNNDSSGSIITDPNETIESQISINSKQQNNSGLPSPQINQSSLNNLNMLNGSQNLNNLNQVQLVDLIALTISNANNIDKNKVTQALDLFIEPTKAKGDNVIDLLKKIADIILKDPSGNTANKIINVAKTK